MIWTCETWNAKPYMAWTGARLVLAEGGRSRLELPVQDHHRYGGETEAVNGAILAYLHDVLQGAAVRSLLGEEVKAIATLNLNVSYMTYLSAGAVLTGEAQVLRMNNSVAFARSEFVDAGGRPCCEATGTFRVMRRRAGAKPAA